MATHSSHSFASPDSPGDTQVVLVLLECSAEMLSYSTELQNYYLPTLLGALQGSNPDIPVRRSLSGFLRPSLTYSVQMRICWCTTADPVHQRPTFSSSASQIPNIRSEPPTPLSISSLRRALEVISILANIFPGPLFAQPLRRRLSRWSTAIWANGRHGTSLSWPRTRRKIPPTFTLKVATHPKLPHGMLSSRHYVRYDIFFRITQPNSDN